MIVASGLTDADDVKKDGQKKRLADPVPLAGKHLYRYSAVVIFSRKHPKPTSAILVSPSVFK